MKQKVLIAVVFLALGVLLGVVGASRLSVYDGTFIIASDFSQSSTTAASLEVTLSDVASLKTIDVGSDENETIVRLDANSATLRDIEQTLNVIINEGGEIQFINLGYSGL